VTPLGLTDKEKTDYLANLWLIATADKALSDQEKALIDQLQKSIQTKRSHNSAAQKAVESGACSLNRSDHLQIKFRTLKTLAPRY
jgi:hypothetical protein